MGLREGIKKAKYEYSMFYAIDLPFGFDVIEDSIREIKNADIIIGSKSHPSSRIKMNPKRKIFSYLYNKLLNIFFHLNIKDTQGSLIFKKSCTMKYIPRLDSSDAFLETQLIIYGKLSNLKIMEIPIELKQNRHKSKIRPFRDGTKMFLQVLKEYCKFKRTKNNF